MLEYLNIEINLCDLPGIPYPSSQTVSNAKVVGGSSGSKKEPRGGHGGREKHLIRRTNYF